MHNTTEKQFRNDIQGLRGIAVLAVVVFHYNAGILRGGFVGVDVFLVISGYLITTILLKRKSDGHSALHILKNFYLGRIKRIAPAYYVLLALVTIAAAVLFIPGDFSYYRESLENASFFSSNNYFSGFGDYFAPGAEELPLLHSWSLAVEMQFYLLMPFFVLFLPRKWLRRLLPLLIVLLSLAAEHQIRAQGDNQSTYYALYARIPEFLVGAWIAMLPTIRDPYEKWASLISGIGLALILFSAAYISSDSSFPGFMALLPSIGAATVIYSGKSRTANFLSLPPLVWIGTISYSLYLWHWPVLAFLRYYKGNYNLSPSMSVVYALATLGLSCLSFYFVEKVFRKSRSAFNARGVALAATLAASVVLISTVSPAINQNLVEPLPVGMRRYADPEEICHGKIVGTCMRGAAAKDTEILVLGDSHAAMLNYFFDAVGQELGITARVITASSCVTIPGFDYQRIRKFSQKACRQQITVVEANYLDSASIIVMAATWSYHLKSKDFQRGLTAFIESRGAKEQKVLLLSEIPKFEKHPLRAHRFETLHIPASLPQDQSFVQGNSILKEIADRHTHVQYIDLTGLPVFNAAPFYNGTLIYHDEHHLNEIGSKVYGKHAAQLLKKVIQH